MVALVLSLLCACSGGKDADTAPIPDTLAPLTDAVPDCPAGLTEGVTIASTREDDFFSAQSCGYVSAPFEDVVTAVQTPEVGIDRRKVVVDDCTITMDADATFPVSYDIDTVVVDLVTVEYTLAWRHDQGADGEWLTRWKMTTDNDFVNLIEGSVVTEVAPEDPSGDTVRVEVVEHIDAVLDSQEEQITTFLQDFYDSIVASAHGQPLPTYE